MTRKYAQGYTERLTQFKREFGLSIKPDELNYRLFEIKDDKVIESEFNTAKEINKA